jgi:hypothetical protein
MATSRSRARRRARSRSGRRWSPTKHNAVRPRGIARAPCIARRSPVALRRYRRYRSDLVGTRRRCGRAHRCRVGARRRTGIRDSYRTNRLRSPCRLRTPHPHWPGGCTRRGCTAVRAGTRPSRRGRRAALAAGCRSRLAAPANGRPRRRRSRRCGRDFRRETPVGSEPGTPPRECSRGRDRTNRPPSRRARRQAQHLGSPSRRLPRRPPLRSTRGRSRARASKPRLRSGRALRLRARPPPPRRGVPTRTRASGGTRAGGPPGIDSTARTRAIVDTPRHAPARSTRARRGSAHRRHARGNRRSPPHRSHRQARRRRQTG